MTKQQIIELARKSVDDAMEIMTDSGNAGEPWAVFYMGKSWAYLSVALGGEGEDT